MFPPGLYEFLFGVKLRASGDKMRPGERCLIIANHRTRLDWMFMWSLLTRTTYAPHEKIILRGDLKHIPGFGWAMQMAGYYFLSRSWAKDQSYLAKKIGYMMNTPEPHKLLIFPEGTDFEPHTKARSDKFAAKEGLPHLEYLLHPRTTGFLHCVEQCRLGSMDSIYDITIMYPKNLPQRGELDLLTGQFPDELHMNIQRIDFNDLPEDKVELEEWLKQRWYNKEKVLKLGYEKGHFEADDPAKPYFTPYLSSRHPLLVNFICWNTVLILLYYLIITNPMTRWYLLGSNIICLVLSSTGLLEDLDRRMNVPEYVECDRVKHE